MYNPSNIGALNNYAYYLSVERRDLDKAEEMSYKTVKAEPNNSTYLDTYAWILFVKGNYAEARLYIDEAIKNDKDSSDVVLEHCGDIYYMTGDAEGALKYWKQAWDKGNRSDTLKQKIQKKKYISDETKPAEWYGKDMPPVVLAVVAGCGACRLQDFASLKFSVRRICLPFLQSAADGTP